MIIIPEWKEVVKFHGHSCMGLALGYRASEVALKTLRSERDIDEELVAICENDSCAVDAVQAVTGCTMGKGNFFFRDYGKQVYTFALRSTGKAVRVAVKGLEENRFPELGKLRRQALSGKASDEEREQFAETAARALRAYLEEPLENVTTIREVKVELPEKARIFNSLNCAACGEKVMEPRARVKDGEPVCIPCAELYERKA